MRRLIAWALALGLLAGAQAGTPFFAVFIAGPRSLPLIGETG